MNLIFTLNVAIVSVKKGARGNASLINGHNNQVRKCVCVCVYASGITNYVSLILRVNYNDAKCGGFRVNCKTVEF